MLAAEGALLLLLLRRVKPLRDGISTFSLTDGLTRDILAGRQAAAAASAAELEAEFGPLGFALPPLETPWGAEVQRAHRAARGLVDGLRRHIELAGLDDIDEAAKDAVKWARTRAELTAATEVSQAWNGARESILLDAITADPGLELELFKQWDATLDKRTCETCSEAHGTIVRVGDSFAWGVPGHVHPRCRCIEQILTADEIGRAPARRAAPEEEPAPEPPKAPQTPPVTPTAPRPAPTPKAPPVPARAAPTPRPAPPPKPPRVIATRPTPAEVQAAKLERRIAAAPVLKHGELKYERVGMRPESLDYALKQLAGGDPTRLAIGREPIIVDIWPDGSRWITDGRHRLAAAQMAGAKAIRVTERVRGPRGGFKSERTRLCRIDPTTPVANLN